MCVLQSIDKDGGFLLALGVFQDRAGSGDHGDGQEVFWVWVCACVVEKPRPSGHLRLPDGNSHA